MEWPVRSSLGFAMGLWGMLSLALPPVAALAGPSEGVLDRVNAIRREAQLITLARSDELDAVAMAHARDMARHGYLDHVDRSGRNPLERAQAAGLSGFHLLAENIGMSDAQNERVDAILRAWLDSPVHRANLMQPAFNTTGIGYATGRSGQTFIVQLFATY